MHHLLHVPRNLVHDVMTLIDPEGMERRGNVGIKKRRRVTFRSMVKIVLVNSTMHPCYSFLLGLLPGD